MENRRIELGIDGDQGYALLGSNLQEGEAEFVSLESCKNSQNPKILAMGIALKNLKKRLDIELDFYIKGI